MVLSEVSSKIDLGGILDLKSGHFGLKEVDVNTSIADRIAELFEQHKSIKRNLSDLEGFVSDADSASRLDELRDQMTSDSSALGPLTLQLERNMAEIQTQLLDHFQLEEDVLKEGYEVLDDVSFLGTLNHLRSDHQKIGADLADLRVEAKRIALAVSNSQDRMERFSSLKARIKEMRTLVVRHAEDEEVAFQLLKDRLTP